MLGAWPNLAAVTGCLLSCYLLIPVLLFVCLLLFCCLLSVVFHLLICIYMYVDRYCVLPC